MLASSSAFAFRLSLFLAASLVFIVLALAGTHFFRRPAHSPPLRFRIHHMGILLLGGLHLAAAGLAPLVSPLRVWIAIGLLLAGLVLFLWAQETVKRSPPHLPFSGVHPGQLFIDGPYRFVRHPIYLAFTVALFAVPVATWDPWLWASAFVMAASFVSAAFEEEAAYARTPYADHHRVYAQSTGMFAPRPPLAVVAIGLAAALTAYLVWDLLSR